MANLRNFLLMQTVDLILEFSETILVTFWSDYNILVWNLNKPFQSFIGLELMAFIKNITIIVIFLRSKFHNTDKLKVTSKGEKGNRVGVCWLLLLDYYLV